MTICLVERELIESYHRRPMKISNVPCRGLLMATSFVESNLLGIFGIKMVVFHCAREIHCGVSMMVLFGRCLVL